MIALTNRMFRILLLGHLLVIPLRAEGEAEPGADPVATPALAEGPDASFILPDPGAAGNDSPVLPLGPPFPPGASGPSTDWSPADQPLAPPPAFPQGDGGPDTSGFPTTRPITPSPAFPQGDSGPDTSGFPTARPIAPPPPSNPGRSGADPAPGWPVVPLQNPIQEDVRANLGNLGLP